MSSVICRFCFDIDIPSQKESAIQQRCSDFFYTCLVGKLSQVFCRISALFNKELSIERLVINLGDIPTPQFEEVLTQRLLTQLAEHLIALLAAVPTAVSGEPPFLQHDTDIAMLHDGNNRRRKMGLQLHSSETIPAKEEGRSPTCNRFIVSYGAE